MSFGVCLRCLLFGVVGVAPPSIFSFCVRLARIRAPKILASSITFPFLISLSLYFPAFLKKRPKIRTCKQICSLNDGYVDGSYITFPGRECRVSDPESVAHIGSRTVGSRRAPWRGACIARSEIDSPGRPL